MVNDTCDEIQRQLWQLKELSHRLGDAMERTADELRLLGASPPAELITDLQKFRDGVFKMRSWLRGQSKQADLEIATAPQTLSELYFTR